MKNTTLEEQLNERADREFDRIAREITERLSDPNKAFGTYAGNSFTGLDKIGNYHQLAVFARSAFEVTHRDEFRANFRAKFIAKVEAMQKEMESYIGALNTTQEGGQ